jgi:hypothetical protein
LGHGGKHAGTGLGEVPGGRNRFRSLAPKFEGDLSNFEL